MNSKDYFLSTEKFLRLDIKVDYIEILKEAINLKNQFVTHKAKSYFHKGWKSLCLHGISKHHIDSWGEYGFKTAEDAGNSSVWTDICSFCPYTMDFLTSSIPSKKFGRVRFELLESQGFIDTHKTKTPVLEQLVVPLNNPKDFQFIWDDGQTLDFNLGSVITINTYHFHKLINNSTEDRYCLVIDRHDSTDEWKSLMNDACIQQNVSGEYINSIIRT